MSSENQSQTTKCHSGHIFVALTFRERRLNDGHPVLQMLNEHHRESLIASVEGLSAIGVSDDWGSAATDSMREHWNSPVEMLVNEIAWNAIKCFEPSTFGCSIKHVLSACTHDPGSLDHLSLDDRDDLERSLMEAAVGAYRSDTDVTLAVHQAMKIWLKNHTGSEGTLEELAHISRSKWESKGKNRYAVDVIAEINLEIQVEAETPEEAAAMAEAWTFHGAGSDDYRDYYDRSGHKEADFTLDWEVMDFIKSEAQEVELVSDEVPDSDDAEIGLRPLLVPISE